MTRRVWRRAATVANYRLPVNEPRRNTCKVISVFRHIIRPLLTVQCNETLAGDKTVCRNWRI